MPIPKPSFPSYNRTPKHHGYLNTLHPNPRDEFRTCWGRVEEFFVAGEQEIVHTKPFFFPFSSAATYTNHPLEVDQSCLCSSKRSMPYTCQLTSLFLFLDIPIPKEEMTILKSRSSYDLTTAQRMGYKMVDGIVTRDLKGKGQAIAEGDDEDVEDEEAANDDDAEDEVENSQSEPVDAPGDADSIVAGDTTTEPSIRDLIAHLQIQMSTGFAKLNDRLDTVDTNIEALADSQVQIQLRLTRLSSHVHEDRQAPTPPGPNDA
ncbi:hypothetical protein Taro_005331 [Colocasia esculenta]|uniref:Uncharacterized protein n=1 Tax=Colocasia esculenta TaxID=4460 RepID=A0A843TXJ5_COLES|nr:hypothetical protein [Colocasia esculenta]